jgi:hypothetical protein
MVMSPSGDVLTQNGRVTDDLTDAKNVKPSFITIIGRRRKATLLGQLLETPSIPVHHQIYLRALPKARTSRTPVVLIDCGVPRWHPTFGSPPWGSKASTSWNIPVQNNVTTTLVSKIFSPFSSVVVYFVSDLGGAKSVAEWLAYHAASPPASDLRVFPRILLVMETTSNSFDESVAASRILSQLSAAVQKVRRYSGTTPVQEDIDRHFQDMTVLGLKSSMTVAERGKMFKKRLLALSDLSMRGRLEAGVQFSLSHFEVLSKQAIEKLSQGTETVPFAHLSRPCGFSIELFHHCLGDFLNQLPSQSWFWHFAAPLIASALLLSSYPPGAHGKLSISLGQLPC